MPTSSQPSYAFTGPNRRRSPRFAVDFPFEIEWGSAVMSGRVCDISLNGMQVALSDTLWVGAQFSARILLEPPVTLNCVVRRAAPGGMGLSFVPADDETRARVETLISGLASP